MRVTGETKVIGIFGYPVRHSLSPLMQNAAIEALGLNYIYIPFEVRPEELETAIKGIRALGISGVNVTIPHKEKVIPFLDEVTEEASLIGSVNTIENKNGKLIGHNTDSRGYIRSLREDAGFDIKGKRAILIGARGAGRAIFMGMASSGASEITIVNRTIEKAEEIKINYTERYRNHSISIRTAPLSYLKEPEVLSSVDLIVNATSMGLEGSAPDVDFASTSPHALISDIVYKPAVTHFLKNAKDAGRRTLGGLGMLIYQGAISFEIWTSKEAPVEAMKKALSIANLN